VVEAVVYAVDVGKPSVPMRPLTIIYTAVGEGRHPDSIGIQTVVEVLYLYPMLNCCYAVNDVLVLAWEGETIG
jgi:hypothetical protein